MDMCKVTGCSDNCTEQLTTEFSVSVHSVYKTKWEITAFDKLALVHHFKI